MKKETKLAETKVQETTIRFMSIKSVKGFKRTFVAKSNWEKGDCVCVFADEWKPSV